MQYVLRAVNNFEMLVPFSTRDLVFSPGDEFHRNPLATALLGVHYQYQNGKGTAGNVHDGVVAIRCGKGDIIQSMDCVIYDT